MALKHSFFKFFRREINIKYVPGNQTVYSEKKNIFPMMSGRQCASGKGRRNNRKLVHRIIDLNGKGKILVSSISSYQFLFQKAICYEKIDVSRQLISQNEITQYEVQVMIMGKVSRLFVAILHLPVCSVWIVYGVYFLDIGICVCFETIPW